VALARSAASIYLKTFDILFPLRSFSPFHIRFVASRGCRRGVRINPLLLRKVQDLSIKVAERKIPLIRESPPSSIAPLRVLAWSRDDRVVKALEIESKKLICTPNHYCRPAGFVLSNLFPSRCIRFNQRLASSFFASNFCPSFMTPRWMTWVMRKNVARQATSRIRRLRSR